MAVLSPEQKAQTRDFFKKIYDSELGYTEAIAKKRSPRIKANDTIKKYDVVYTNQLNFDGNWVAHYGVVYKVKDDLCYCLTITSGGGYAKFPINESRIFAGSYFTPSFAVFPLIDAIKNFVFIYDAKKEFDNAVKTIKNHISKL